MWPLQNHTRHDGHLLPCKQKPRIYTPQDGKYAVVRDGEELLDAVLAPGRGERLIRISDELLYLEVPEALVVPEGINATIDCQGSVIDMKRQPKGSVPGAGSAMNFFGCCAIGMSIGPEVPAEAGVFSDVTVKFRCQVRILVLCSEVCMMKTHE